MRKVGGDGKFRQIAGVGRARDIQGHRVHIGNGLCCVCVWGGGYLYGLLDRKGERDVHAELNC